MKILVISTLLVPSIAMAGVVLVDDGAPPKVGGTAAVSVAASGGVVTQISVVGDAGAVVPPSPPVQTWTLRQGRLVGHELQDWAELAGWHVVWQLPHDIVVPADTTYSGDFQKSASDVITTLASNGMLIYTKFYEANKTMRVFGPGTTAPQ